MGLSKQILFFMCLMSILLLPGCAHYRARPIGKLYTGIATKTKQEQYITFAYHIFNHSDCKLYLDRDVISKGYLPVHITLTNHTNRHLYVSLKSFSFPCMPAEVVAQKVHTSTAKRAAGYGIASLFIWPFLIPAIIDGIGSSEANKLLDMDFTNKALNDQIMTPFSMINGLVFVPYNDFHKNFTFTVIDHETQEHFELSQESKILKIMEI